MTARTRHRRLRRSTAATEAMTTRPSPRRRQSSQRMMQASAAEASDRISEASWSSPASVDRVGCSRLCEVGWLESHAAVGGVIWSVRGIVITALPKMRESLAVSTAGLRGSCRRHLRSPPRLHSRHPQLHWPAASPPRRQGSSRRAEEGICVAVAAASALTSSLRPSASAIGSHLALWRQGRAARCPIDCYSRRCPGLARSPPDALSLLLAYPGDLEPLR